MSFAKIAHLQGGGVRPLVTDANGVPQAQDAATFRSTIGAQENIGYTPVDKSGDTMAGDLSSSYKFMTEGLNGSVKVSPGGTGYSILISAGLQRGSIAFRDDEFVGNGRVWQVGTGVWGTSDFHFGTIDDNLSDNPSLKIAFLRSGGIQVGQYKVIGSRQPGWSAPTGTATRSTFATSTVTTEQLAERLKALIDDLTSHGLIGS